MLGKNLILCSLMIFSGNVFSANSKNLRSVVSGEILVKYKSTLSSLAQKDAIEREGGTRLSRVTTKGWARVKYRADMKMSEAIAEYKKDPNVESAQPNFIYRALALPNDPRFSQQWGLRNTAQTITTAGGPDSPSSTNNPGVAGRDMNLQYAWNTITDCSSAVVAVLDSGINYNHSDLAANMWTHASYPNHGYDFIDNDNNPMDSNGHGTHVAGTIGAVGNNSTGGSGVCWNAKLMAVRVLDTTGSGTTAALVSGINFAISNGAKVINLSLGGGDFDNATSTAITNARTSGVLVIAAAGNDGTDNEAVSSPSYPCNYAQDNVLCVAAMTQSYALASFSNFGALSVDIGAPGVNIVSTWPGTHATVTDSMKTGWNFSSTTGSGWTYKNLNFGSQVACLVNPINYNYSSATYANNMDARAWKSFSIANADAASASLYLMNDTEAGDSISVHAKAGSSDPMTSGSTLAAFTGSTDGYREPFSYDLTPFVGGNVSVGFKLLTDASGVDLGTNISEVSIQTLVYNTTTYNVISGTSMATPHIAGLAAMLFAYNPNYTYTDVANAIKNGGVNVAALSGKTTTGKAASAIGSLNYINAPTGVGAVKLP